MDYLTKSVIKRYSQKEEVDYWSITEEGLSAVEEELIRKHFIGKGKKVLVIGCGGGREAFSLLEVGFDVVGLDLAFSMVKAARRNNISNSNNIPFINANATDLPFKNSSFDYATMFGTVFPHIPHRKNRIRVLTQLRDILKPDGIFILHILNINLIPNFIWFQRRIYRNFLWLYKSVKNRQWSNTKCILSKMIVDFNKWRRLPFYRIRFFLISVGVIFNNMRKMERGDSFINNTSFAPNRIKAFFHFYTRGELARDLKTAGLEIISVRGEREPREELVLKNLLFSGDPALFIVVKSKKC